MKTLLKYVSLWVPCVYAAAISGIALIGWSHSSISMSPGFPSFIAFLPMAFFFSALGAQSQVSRLEKRIESLEKLVGPRT